MFRLPPILASRIVAWLLVAATLSPGVQWCRFAWRDVPAECFAECAVATSMAGCPADAHASRSPCDAGSSACEGAACHARPCDADRAPRSDEPSESGPGGGRAWCPFGPVGGPTADARAHHDVPQPAVLDAMVPDASDRLHRGPRRTVECAFARPPTREPTRTPPARAPPTA